MVKEVNGMATSEVAGQGSRLTLEAGGWRHTYERLSRKVKNIVQAAQKKK